MLLGRLHTRHLSFPKLKTQNNSFTLIGNKFRIAEFRFKVQYSLWQNLPSCHIIILIGPSMFNATFNLVTHVRLYFWKNCSLQIDSLTFNNCLSFRNVFKNTVKALSKMVLKNPAFQKLKNLFILFYFVQISPSCSPNPSRIVWRDF